MKYNYLLLTLFSVFYINAQNTSKEYFKEVRGRVAKVIYADPLGAREDALLLKKIAKNNNEKTIAYQCLGYVYDLSGNADSARYYFTKQLNLTKKHFSKEVEYYQSVIDFANWGTTYVDGEVLVKELTFALQDIDEVKFKREKGLLLLLLGDVFLRDKDTDKAEYYLDKSNKFLNGKYAEVDYYYRKSGIEVQRNNYEKGKKYILKALDALKDKEINAYPLMLTSLGHIYLLQNDYSNAKQYLHQSLHYQNKNNFKGPSSATYLDLYYLEKRFEKNSTLEKYYLDKALEFNEGDINLLRDIYLAYKDYYSRNNDSNSELEYLNKYNNINDSIFNIEKVKVKTNIESQFQLNENKKELALKEKIIQKDKNIKLTYLIGVSLLGLLIFVIVIFYFLRLKTQKKLRKNQKLLHEEQLKLMLENQRTEIIKEKIKAKVEERGKLSLELHDGIASEISALKLSLATESTLSKSEIDELVEKIDKLYSEIRNLSHSLDPDNIDFVEFSQFVANLCKQIEKSGLQTTKNLYITKKVDDLEVETLVNVYRIIQEIVTNILKHANATEVVFDVVETDDTLYIHIKDNGVGFDVKESKQGIGLKNIQKRVASFKGNFSIETEKGNGAEVKINLPII